MRKNWNDIVNSWLYKSLPFIVSAVLLLFSYIPLSSAFLNNARSAVGLICVYFWVVYRSDLFNLFSVFMLGLVADLISMSLMGSNIFSFLVMYILASYLIKYLNGKVFIVLWFGFGVLLIGPMLGRWLLTSIYYNNFLPFGVLVFSYLVSFALYPIIGGINALILNHLLQEEW